jgi:recombination protein RecT
MTEQALATHEARPMERVRNYMLSPEVKERFSEMMGPNGIYYLNQVLITVANSEELQKCDPKSILVSAMRAASLRLSVEPSSGQAWIIPYKGKASFQLGYKGVYELALRTNQYRFINVITIYEGEEVVENRMTGLQTIEGKRTGDTVIGYMLYFQLLKGYEKTFYMTVEEIEDHARRYSQSYKFSRSPWNDPHERPKMMKKTVLVNGLRKWGRFNQDDKLTLDAIEEEQGWNGEDLPDPEQVTVEKREKKSPAQIMAEMNPDWADPSEPIEGEYNDAPDMVDEAEAMGGEVAEKAPEIPEAVKKAMAIKMTDGSTLGDLNDSQLEDKIANLKAGGLKTAAQTLLDWRIKNGVHK